VAFRDHKYRPIANFPLRSSRKPGQGPPQPPLLSTVSETASSRGPKAVPTATPSEGAKYCNSQEPPVNAVPRNARPGNQRPKSDSSTIDLNYYLNLLETRPTGMLSRLSLEFSTHMQNLGSTASSAPQISESEVRSDSR
jgi:hypothetical protein